MSVEVFYSTFVPRPSVATEQLKITGNIKSHESCMKFFLLISVKMPTIVGILTFMSRKNSILGLYDPETKLNFMIFLFL